MHIRFARPFPRSTATRSSAPRRLAAAALTAVLATGVATPATAAAQDWGAILDPVLGPILGEVGFNAIAGSLAYTPVGSVANSLGSVGSADFPIVSGSVEPVGTPTTVDPNIDATELLDVTHDSQYEHWTIQSASMQRVVTVEVLPYRGEEAAPVLYMLDGVNGSNPPSGWRSAGRIHERMADERVHVVAPTGAFASFYADWEKEDPVLGNHRWETFLTEELPPIVDSRLSTTGRAGIVGCSMGAQSAMHLAAQHEELYDGVMALSGNYSTTDELGYQTIRLTVETRGGDIDNMWGPRGSAKWRYHDTISHAEKLRGRTVYMSAANGVVGPTDPDHYRSNKYAMFLAIPLERGVLEATRSFGRALERAGVEYTAFYDETGLHNWEVFLRGFDRGWADFKKDALGL